MIEGESVRYMRNRVKCQSGRGWTYVCHVNDGGENVKQREKLFVLNLFGVFVQLSEISVFSRICCTGIRCL